MKELYVVNCCRTAVGSFGGSLKNTPAAELGAIVVKEALKRANVAPENVDELMFGCILTSGLGQNVARQVSVGAGLPYSVPAYTVGMVCGSGMKSVIEAGRAILAGDADIIVCGGTENMSAAPYASTDARWGARMGDKKLVDTMIKDGLWDAFNNYHMGTTAENICDVWGITREELDAFGAASQQKTEAAQASGRFDAEIVPVPVKVKKEIVEFKKDEFPRAGSTVEGLAKLRGAFPVGPEGVEDQIVHTFQPTEIHEADTRKHVQRVTAGNASGINDGAAAIVLASGEAVAKYNLKPMAKLVSWGQGGVDPKIMGVGPVPASRQAMAKAGLTIKDMDGGLVDTVVNNYTDLMLLDCGFFGDNEYLWTTALDVYGAVPETTMHTYRVGRMNTGDVSLGEPITYAVVYSGSYLNVINTRQLRLYDYHGTLSADSTVLVYGWQLVGSTPTSGDPYLLFAPVLQTDTAGSFSELRLLHGKTDTRYSLPDSCVGAAIHGKRLYAFSGNSLYRADISAQRFTALRLPVDGTVTDYLGMTSNGVALLVCGTSVWAVSVP